MLIAKKPEECNELHRLRGNDNKENFSSRKQIKQAKCNGNTVNNIGHEERNKQTKELLMPGKLKQSSSFRENV